MSENVPDQTPALTDDETAADFIRRLLSAWECCASCAGGVLMERDARIMADAVAAALAPVERLAERARVAAETSGYYPRKEALFGVLDALDAALAEGKEMSRG